MILFLILSALAKPCCWEGRNKAELELKYPHKLGCIANADCKKQGKKCRAVAATKAPPGESYFRGCMTDEAYKKFGKIPMDEWLEKYK